MDRIKFAAIVVLAGLFAASYSHEARAESATLINYKPIKTVDPDDGWRPLSPSEMAKRTLELTFEAAELSAEAADSLKMTYVSDRIFDIIDLSHKAINKREHFKNKFHMSLEIKGDHGLLVYQKRY